MNKRGAQPSPARLPASPLSPGSLAARVPIVGSTIKSILWVYSKKGWYEANAVATSSFVILEDIKGDHPRIKLPLTSIAGAAHYQKTPKHHKHLRDCGFAFRLVDNGGRTCLCARSIEEAYTWIRHLNPKRKKQFYAVQEDNTPGERQATEEEKANTRWQEMRVLVDSLSEENVGLRAALEEAHKSCAALRLSVEEGVKNFRKAESYKKKLRDVMRDYREELEAMIVLKEEIRKSEARVAELLEHQLDARAKIASLRSENEVMLKTRDMKATVAQDVIITSLKARLSSHEKDERSLRADRTQLGEALKELTAKTQLLMEQNAELRGAAHVHAAQLEREREDAEEKAESLSRQLREATTHLRDATQRLARKDQEVSSLNAQLAVARREALDSAHDVERQKLEHMGTAQHLRSELAASQKLVASLQAKSQQDALELERQREALAQHAVTSEQQLTAAEKRLEDARAKLVGLSEKAQSADSDGARLEEARKHTAAITQERDALAALLDAQHAEAEALRDRNSSLLASNERLASTAESLQEEMDALQRDAQRAEQASPLQLAQELREGQEALASAHARLALLEPLEDEVHRLRAERLESARQSSIIVGELDSMQACIDEGVAERELLQQKLDVFEEGKRKMRDDYERRILKLNEALERVRLLREQEQQKMSTTN